MTTDASRMLVAWLLTTVALALFFLAIDGLRYLSLRCTSIRFISSSVFDPSFATGILFWFPWSFVLERYALGSSFLIIIFAMLPALGLTMLLRYVYRSFRPELIER